MLPHERNLDHGSHEPVPVEELKALQKSMWPRVEQPGRNGLRDQVLVGYGKLLFIHVASQSDDLHALPADLLPATRLQAAHCSKVAVQKGSFHEAANKQQAERPGQQSNSTTT